MVAGVVAINIMLLRSKDQGRNVSQIRGHNVSQICDFAKSRVLGIGFVCLLARTIQSNFQLQGGSL